MGFVCTSSISYQKFDCHCKNINKIFGTSSLVLVSLRCEELNFWVTTYSWCPVPRTPRSCRRRCGPRTWRWSRGCAARCWRWAAPWSGRPWPLGRWWTTGRWRQGGWRLRSTTAARPGPPLTACCCPPPSPSPTEKRHRSTTIRRTENTQLQRQFVKYLAKTIMLGSNLVGTFVMWFRQRQWSHTVLWTTAILDLYINKRNVPYQSKFTDYLKWYN